MTGLDIHGGLRIRLEYNTATKAIEPKFSAETPTTVTRDVRRYICELATMTERNLGYANQWLREFEKRTPEAPEERV